MPTARGVGLLYASLAAAHWRLPDATRTFRVRIRSGRRVRLAFGIVRVWVRLTRLVAGSLGQTADTLIGREEGGSPIVLVFHSAAESARERVWEERTGAGRGEREAGCARPSTLLLGNRQTRIYSFISVIICLYFGFFLFSSFFDRGTLALISTC